MKHFNHNLIALLLAVTCIGGVNAGELTVADGSATHEKLPVYPYYGDVSGARSQVIFPASYLESLQGGTITSITFYTGTQAKKAMTTVYTVSLAVVEQSEFASASYLNVESTVVYEGTIDASQTIVTLELATPFVYEEGNLFLDIQTKAKGNYDDASFLGINGSTNTAIYHSTYGGQLAAFLPKTTFVFDEPSGSTCARPSKLTAEATPDGGVFSWQGEEEAQFQVCIVASGAEAAGWQLLEAGVFTYTAKGLVAGTTYDFYVRTYCSEADQSTAAKVSFTPVCKAPTQVELSELSHNTATFAWTAAAGVSQYQYLCVLKDSTPDWEGVEPKEVLNVTIDTLQPSTAYDFYVRSYFSASVQSEAVKTTFTTNCVANTLPYNETFDNSISLPACWEASNVSNANWTVYTFSDENTYSGYSLHFTGKNNYVATLKTPAVELSEKALLKFYWKNSSAASANIQISTNGGSTKTDLPNDLSSTCNSMTEKTIDLSAYEGETVILYFSASTSASSNRHIYMDELSIVTKPCEMPKQLNADVSSSGAVVTWDAGGDEDSWNLRYRAVGSDEWQERKALIASADTLSGLTAGSEYEVQVQAACSAEKKSEWTASVTFTPQCPVPTAVAVSQITDAEAMITWNGTETQYNLQYRETGAEDWISVADIKAKEYALSGLTGSTGYEVRVQSACEGDFSSVKSFTTACAPLAEALPFVEDFEAVTSVLPDCWARRTEGEYPVVMPSKSAYGIPEESDSTANCLVFSGEGEQMIILPAFASPLNGQSLSFFYKVSASAVTMEIGWLANLYGTFQPLEELNNEVYAYTTTAHELPLSNLPAEAQYLAIRYTSTSQWTSAHVDNVRIDEASLTAIDAVRDTKKVTEKVIENGQLILLYNSTKFDATGRKL